MSKKANPAAIGIFVVGALVIILAGLIVLGAGQMFEKKKRFVLYFDGNTNGLDVGSDVSLGGVKVGAILEMRVQIDPNTNRKIIPVIIELSADRIADISVAQKDKKDILEDEAVNEIIEKGLMGRLASKSVLTGQLYIELDLFPLKREQKDYYMFEVEDGETTLEGLQQIPTTKSEINRTLEKLSNIDLGKLVTTIEDTVAEAKTLITDLNSKVVELDVKGISEKANSTLAKADSTFAKVEELIGDEKIKSTIASIDEAAKEFKDLLAAIDGEAVNGAVVGAEETIKEAGEAIKVAGDALKKIELAAGNIADNTGSDAALTVRLNRTLSSIEHVSKSIKELTDYLKRNPNSILAGRKRP